jgi:RecJ-like exonuclease
VISEFANELEGEIKSISKLSPDEHKNYLNKIIGVQKKRSEVKEIPFLVNSIVLDKLRQRFIKAAEEIRLAIIQNRPIIVRHHNDTDGYCAGYALEKAILPLIEKEHGSEKAGWEYFLRAPCAAPFYEIDDSIRDTAISLRNVAKFSNKMPLIIITDNGSTEEDLFGILHGKVHGMEFIVIDHHYFEKDMISSQVLTHINPFLVGEDGTKFSAGMLCAEFARLINNDVTGLEPVPALAGFADRIDLNNPAIMEDYLKIAKKQGYTKELLSDISSVIDFVSAKIRFLEGREYIGVIFGEPRDKQKALVDLMAPYISRLEQKGLEMAKANAIIEKIKKTNLQVLNIETTFPGFGFYPKPGKAIGLVHDYLQKTKNIKNLITIGRMNTAMTIRATDDANFSVHELISYLNKNSPDSFVEGGGHKNAGSISFIPNKKDEIFTLTKKFIEERQTN